MELFCPREFRRDTPKGIEGDWRSLYEGKQQGKVENIRVPILALAHVTHKAEADKIKTDHSYEFRPAPKCGRPGTGSCMWNPSILFDYVPISEKTNLFQGNYSWWSPYAHNYDLPEDHPNREYCISPAQIAAGILPQKDYYVANYLKNPPESFYGDHVFPCSFTELLIAYVQSRNSGEVFIKIGGTLRYRGEICFVLIVCTENDDLGFPALHTNDEYFETNGLIDDDGRVRNYNAIANFHPRYIIQWAREDEGKKSYSYITAAFAFYYPDILLAVDRKKCGTPKINKHTDEFCLKKLGKKCPNNIGQ